MPFTLRPPTEAEAARLFGAAAPVQVLRDAAGMPGWQGSQGGAVIGHIGSTSEIAGSVGYSGRPLDVLVAIGTEACIKGARIGGRESQHPRARHLPKPP